MGLLDSMFGGGGGQDQSQGPQSPGVFSRFQAQYAPGAYAAKEQAMQQQAIYQAALQTPGMSPQTAQALAMSPQFFAAQQQSYLPQATQVVPVQNSDGSQTLYQNRNSGGGAGHGVEISGIPITEPPGTTSAPAGAAGAQGQGATTPPTNTLSGMPGSNTATEKAVRQAAETGADPFQALAGSPYAADVKAVLDNRMTLSEIKQTRQEHAASTIRHLVLAIDPNFNELKSEKTGTYVKSYMDTKTGDVGMSRNALGTALGHISDSVDRQLELKNHDANMELLGNADNHIRNWFGEQANKAKGAELNVGTAADELARFITGKPPTDSSRNEYRNSFPSPTDTPRVAAEKYNVMAELVEKRMQDLELERDANFSGKNVAKDYPIVLEQHKALLSNIRQKAAELKRQGEYQIEHGAQGLEAPPEAPAGNSHPAYGLPQGWKYIPQSR